MAHNQISLLPERDRMIAEAASVTYRQNADGSSNPTGEAAPQEGPQVHRGHVDNGPAVVTKPVDPEQVETPSSPPGEVVTKPVTPAKKTTAKKTAAKKAPARKTTAKKSTAKAAASRKG